jgi:hypothetical protein
MSFELCEEFNKLNLRIIANMKVMDMEVDSTIFHDIQKGQLEDEKIREIKILKKISHLVSWRVTKVRCGTKERFMCLMLRS